ncbi:pilus assembly protein [Rhodospirillaceae bacterium AH-315-P19]|nr:pilus assembly protein [Rhodospirillaceae bacterium AH-315-P19]
MRKDQRGSVLVEIAFILPILVTMMLAGVELSRYVLLQQKLDAIAITTADLVSQREEISAATVDQIFAAAGHVIAPFTFGADGIVMVTSVSASGGNGPRVDWQRSGGGMLSASSTIGTPGGGGDASSWFSGSRWRERYHFGSLLQLFAIVADGVFYEHANLSSGAVPSAFWRSGATAIVTIAPSV